MLMINMKLNYYQPKALEAFIAIVYNGQAVSCYVTWGYNFDAASSIKLLGAVDLVFGCIR